MTTQTKPRIMGLTADKREAVIEHNGRRYQWLQDIGYVTAKPVEALKPGEFRVYNFGSTAEIVSVEQVGKMWALTVRTDKGELWTKKHRKGTAIAYAEAQS